MKMMTLMMTITNFSGKKPQKNRGRNKGFRPEYLPVAWNERK